MLATSPRLLPTIVHSPRVLDPSPMRGGYLQNLSMPPFFLVRWLLVIVALALWVEIRPRDMVLLESAILLAAARATSQARARRVH
jgi:hypothetical protein